MRSARFKFLINSSFFVAGSYKYVPVLPSEIVKLACVYSPEIETSLFSVLWLQAEFIINPDQNHRFEHCNFALRFVCGMYDSGKKFDCYQIRDTAYCLIQMKLNRVIIHIILLRQIH